MNQITDLYYFIISDLSTFQLMGATFGIAAAGMFAAVLITRFGEKILPKPSETRLSDFLPFEKLLDDGKTIQCHNGAFVRVYKARGADMAFTSQVKREELLESRKKWIDTIAELNVEGRLITLRQLVEQRQLDPHSNSLLQRVAEAWEKSMVNVYENNHYLVVSVPDRKDALRDLNQACSSLEATLANYEVVSLQETATSSAKEGPLHLFAQITSPITRPMPKVGQSMTREEINDLLTADHIHFTKEEGLLRFFAGDKEKYCAVIGIRKPADYVDEQMPFRYPIFKLVR